jgi:hypothetical protein
MNVTCVGVNYGAVTAMPNPLGPIADNGPTAGVTFQVTSISGLATNDANITADNITLNFRNVDSALSYFPSNDYTITI